MNALARRARELFGGVRLHDKPRAEPEPAFAQRRRPVTGLFGQLSAEQQRKALEYRGEEAHGSAEFLRPCKHPA